MGQRQGNAHKQQDAKKRFGLWVCTGGLQPILTGNYRPKAVVPNIKNPARNRRPARQS
jgi:hypothetical protein